MQPTIGEYNRQKRVNYPSSVRSVWHVEATSNNQDFSGPHTRTTIGYVECTYGRAYEWALQQPRFSLWQDADGYITSISIAKLQEYTP